MESCGRVDKPNAKVYVDAESASWKFVQITMCIVLHC
jgi:uncharacterized membrane protein